MTIAWEKVIGSPLGFAGYALSLLFSLVSLTAKAAKPRWGWIVPAGFVLATISVVAGLSLAYRHEAATQVAPSGAPPPAQSMHVDNVDQKVQNGNAVNGVQGNVTINSSSTHRDSNAKH